MFNYKVVLPFFILFSSLTFGQEKLRAYLDEKQFYAPTIGNYVEIQLQFVGYSLSYNTVVEGLQGEVAVRMSVKSGQEVVASDAYRLQSPIMKDSIIDDFYDIRRFVLAPGEYTFDIELTDLNRTENSVKATQQINILDFSQEVSISDIQIAEVASKGDENSIFFKSGYNIIPRLSTFYPSELTKLPVYLEIYNTNTLKDSVFALRQVLTNALTGEQIESLTRFSKHQSSKIEPVLRGIDISQVLSGKYILNFSVLSKDLVEITSKKYEFERSNDLEKSVNAENIVLDPSFQASITEDSLSYYLASFIPISKSAETKNILQTLKTRDNEKMRKHIQAFWIQTSGVDAFEQWIQYKQQIQFVERIYKNNFQAGYETDRGRVYLQYGGPTNMISKESSSSEYPYEIWQYNKIGKFSNKRFIFYNPDLVANSYRLMHSDMVGELKNPSWPQMLSKRTSTNGNVDNPNQDIQPTYGGNSNNYYRQY
jgi:GWxTD domain-containing protein